MTHRDGTEEPGGADEIAAARDALDGRHEPLDGRRDAVDGERDVLSDLSETDSLRLQTVMDRKSKVQEALANLVKKQGEAEGDITDNLK